MADAPILASPLPTNRVHSDHFPEPVQSVRAYYEPKSTSSAYSSPSVPLYAESSPPYKNDKKTHIFGLRKSTFWLLVVVGILVVLVTVGGSVGGTLAVQSRNKEPPQTASTASPTSSLNSTTPSSTTSSSNDRYTPPAAQDVAFIDISCPANNKVVSSNGVSYTCIRGKNVGGQDVMAMVAFSLQQCVDACREMNKLSSSTEEPCKGVILAEDLKERYINGNRANCWLKSSMQNAVDCTECVMAVQE
ncbi:unnamed protein product [Periconia digitata]|uniref:Uncharacterized protein n=1 Tax=Periconia digitata TaxID=1303443 RepID=A0A9W4XVL0_9PLEO|nr:unnamed protein product [Periconia digitata]